MTHVELNRSVPLNEFTDKDWQTISSDLLESMRNIDDVLDYGSEEEKEKAKQQLQIMFPQMFERKE